MREKIDVKSLLKWIPVAIAGVIAVVQAIDDKKGQEHIEDMENRISKLEDRGEA